MEFEDQLVSEEEAEKDLNVEIDQTFNQIINLAGMLYTAGKRPDYIKILLNDICDKAYEILRDNVEASGYSISDLSEAVESNNLDKYLKIAKAYDEVLEKRCEEQEKA